MKLKSFGCSFTYGNDLSDCTNLPGEGSVLTWPALLAKSMNYDYECYAWPGIGNLQIYYSVIDHITQLDSDLMVINWTWIDRFDFLDPHDQEIWITLRPDGDKKEHQLYYKYFYNQYSTMLSSLTYMLATINLLKKYNKSFIMTSLDPDLFAHVDPEWHDPRPIELLQKEIMPYITQFDGDSFLSWAKKKGFPVSETLHPLDSAHQAAVELIQSYNLV